MFSSEGNSLNRLQDLLSTLDQAIKCFADELKAQKVWLNTTVVVASEFGRSLTANGNGVDHGWGGNYFVFGGAVKGGHILGEYPDDLSLESRFNVGRGRILPTTPWESVWNAVAQWMGLDNERIPDVLPNLKNFATSGTIIDQADLFV